MRPAPAFALLIIAFAVQNAEESLLLPAWAATHMGGLPVSPDRFTLATVLLTGITAVIGLIALPRARWPLALIAGALLANALTHLTISALTLSLMPGALSGLLLQGPAALGMMHSLRLPPRQQVAYTAIGLPLSALAAGLGLALAGVFVD